MDGLKKIGRFIRNCVELYIPIVAFVALFLIFCFQVFMRYIANNPQSWTLEVEQMCFLWLVLLGACFAQREKAHVSFTLLYDMLGVKGKALTAMLGNLVIAVTFAVAFIPSLRYIWGLMSRAQVTSILKIPKTLVFFPYVIFLGFILVYSLLDIYEEIRVLQGDQRYINKMLNEGKSEAEQAVEDAIQQENGEAEREGQ
ncbi:MULTISPECIES: TRAP transporter small permease [unclassified Oscillibacter]|uniref:TRAP transporter small permease n=1 Tax=unclassified Oscillibacter TaxID=2629304 RepID=UPI0025DB63C6|nr:MULTISPECIES: TRAP transporter small permease [unclassified Oscillibacter]